LGAVGEFVLGGFEDLIAFDGLIGGGGVDADAADVELVEGEEFACV
jgi:hypothetical protein